MFRPIVLLWCAWFVVAASAAPAPAAPVVLVMGDSLSAGYGLDAGQGWVSLLEQKIRSQGGSAKVVNASVSGETTAGGLARFPAALDRHRPGIVLLELGANDGLRGLPVREMEANLQRMAELAKKSGAEVVLFEMRIPSNYGPAYTGQFAQAFGAVAERTGSRLVPFFLGSLVDDPARWFQDDGLHPNAAAQPRILDAVWPVLSPRIAHKKTTSPTSTP